MNSRFFFGFVCSALAMALSLPTRNAVELHNHLLFGVNQQQNNGSSSLQIRETHEQQRSPKKLPFGLDIQPNSSQKTKSYGPFVVKAGKKKRNGYDSIYRAPYSRSISIRRRTGFLLPAAPRVVPRA
jgi:hypothetical protein